MAAPGRRAAPVAAGVGAVVLAALVALDDAEAGTLLYAVFSVGLVVTGWWTAWSRRHGRPRAARWVAGAVALTFVGDLLNVASGTTLDELDPVLSVADVAYLSAYVALIVGVATLTSSSRTRRNAFLANTLGVGISGMLVAGGALHGPPWAESPWAFSGENAVLVVYVVADVALLAGLAGLVVLSGRRSPATWYLAAGAFVWTVGDLGRMAAQIDASGFGRSDLFDLTFLGGQVLFTCALLSAWPAPPTDDAADATGAPVRSRLALDLVLPLAPTAIGLVALASGRDLDPSVVLASTGVLAALVVLQTSRLLRAREVAADHLRRKQRFYQALAANSSDAVLVLGPDARVLSESGALGHAMGAVDPAQVVGLCILDVVVAEDRAAAEEALVTVLRSPGKVISFEARIVLPDRPRYIAARAVNLLDDPDVAGIVVNAHDVTDRKAMEVELSHRAYHDHLTGLANRTVFKDRVDHALRAAGAGEGGVAVLFVDLDGFKNVNDSLGHDSGDDLLRVVADRLRAAARAQDTVARLGGDEFAVLIAGSTDPVGDAERLATRLLRVLDAPIALGDRLVTVRASIGIALGDATLDATGLLRRADIAMYQAKAAGKGRWALFEPSMEAAALERLQLGNDLVDAIGRDEVRLAYQPVVDLATGALVGFEALLRWRHPSLGEIAPDRFIPVAEETGLIVPTGAWVLESACAQLSAWRAAHPAAAGLTMAVNVAPRQLADPELTTHLARSLERCGLEPSRLVLEVTEGSLVIDPPAMARRLGEVRALGVRIALDDFGTGYSSLAYLRQFPIDLLKMDRTFISAIEPGQPAPALVRGLLHLGRTLELQMVAEGIEHEHQREVLREAGCDLGQGFLFSAPLTPPAAETLILASRMRGPTASRLSG